MMKMVYMCALTSLILAIPGCGGDTDKAEDTDSGGGADSGGVVASISPVEGDWAFGSGSWVSDECEATFLSTPIGWTLSNSTETGFDLSFRFAEAGSMSAEPSCTLDGSDYACGTVGQSFSIGSASINLDATVQGSFSSDSAASMEVTFDIECSGGGCGGLLSTNPCSSVQSFNVFFDG